ncbi:MAG: DUF4339 domain-containing protein [Proteobacteria bacterium]|nr:DUF4339 domain-containing protein [Pseudomonadota bacterium]
MSDPSWFYADPTGTQQGPVDAAFLRDAIQRGSLGPNVKVWRDGLGGWVPFQQVAGEFGIDRDAAGWVSNQHPASGASANAPGAQAGGSASAVRELHSGLGVAAFITACFAAVLSLVLIVIAAVMETSTPGWSTGNTPGANAAGLAVVVNWAMCALAIGLAIGGFFQKNRKNVFAIAGLVIAVVTVVVWIASVIAGTAE